MKHDIFNELFVLELANNHLGSVERGLQIIEQFAQVVRFNNVKATIKLQFRDVDNFIHKDHKEREDVRYIKKTRDTKLSREDYTTLVQAVRDSGCLTSATAFDEASVDLCEELRLDLLKLASSDINDWFLIERVSQARKPISFSTGGSSEKDIDDAVAFFTNRKLPIALNHCVSIYPCDDEQLELNQIDYLRDRYPGIPIGLSTHEYGSWDASMLIAYAKGARLFERHIDIDSDGIQVSPYCSLPHQIDQWFKSFNKAKEMCGGPSSDRRRIPRNERQYLDALVRGVYAKIDLPADYRINHASVAEDFYLAIPLMKGQLSCRELINGEKFGSAVKKDEPVLISHLDSAYVRCSKTRSEIMERGL
jgi:N-acetylneuraminate synthase